MHRIFALIAVFLFTCTAYSQSRPFPQHTAYTAGSIKPGLWTQGDLDEAVRDYYDYWKASYLRPHPLTAGQYYVLTHPENEGIVNKTVTVSEGHGYGMLFAVVMAGHDANAQTYFDGLYWYYKDHSSINNPALMAWNQIYSQDGDLIDHPNGGNDSATDGDMDIAYALLLADQQWGSAGAIDYMSEAQTVIAAIMDSEVNQNLWILKLGDWVGDTGMYAKGTRLSDFMFNHLKAFQSATGDSNWTNVLDQSYLIAEQLFENYSAKTGLMPDFTRKRKGKFQPAGADYLESEFDGNYYWNSCRTPWRMTIDYLLSGDSRAYSQLTKLNKWVRNKTSTDPTRITAGYYLNGSKLPDPFDNALAFVAPFAVSATINAVNQDWLNQLWTHLLATPQDGTDYYGESIQLHSMIVTSGNWWTP
jgi:endo-1,4-beta-D-glucanase Y